MPAVTHMEIIAVAAAAIFLCVTPILFAFGNARRRRVAALQTTAPPPVPASLPLVADSASAFEPLPTAAWPASDESTESEWPPVPPATSSEPAAQVGTAPTAQFAALPPAAMSPAAPLNPILPPPVDSPAAARAASITAPPPEPLIRETAFPAIRHGAPISDSLPVAQVAAFDAPPAAEEGRGTCQLIELRQARLPEWPPSAVRSDPERERLWETGERLAARFDRVISTTSLRVSGSMQSNALGGVVTDGQSFRLHFLLFDELWPTDPGQAQAEAVFEIDPETGPKRSWVIKR